MRYKYKNKDDGDEVNKLIFANLSSLNKQTKIKLYVRNSNVYYDKTDSGKE